MKAQIKLMIWEPLGTLFEESGLRMEVLETIRELKEKANPSDITEDFLEELEDYWADGSLEKKIFFEYGYVMGLTKAAIDFGPDSMYDRESDQAIKDAVQDIVEMSPAKNSKCVVEIGGVDCEIIDGDSAFEEIFGPGTEAAFFVEGFASAYAEYINCVSKDNNLGFTVGELSNEIIANIKYFTEPKCLEYSILDNQDTAKVKAHTENVTFEQFTFERTVID